MDKLVATRQDVLLSVLASLLAGWGIYLSDTQALAAAFGFSCGVNLVFVLTYYGKYLEGKINDLKTETTIGWQPPETIPHDRIILVKTSTGIISAQCFDGEWSEHYENGPEHTPPVLSCYDDAITLDCDYNEDGSVYFPEVLGWAEIPQ